LLYKIQPQSWRLWDTNVNYDTIKVKFILD
jgi:hypothetical protein